MSKPHFRRRLTWTLFPVAICFALFYGFFGREEVRLLRESKGISTRSGVIDFAKKYNVSRLPDGLAVERNFSSVKYTVQVFDLYQKTHLITWIFEDEGRRVGYSRHTYSRILGRASYSRESIPPVTEDGN